MDLSILQDFEMDTSQDWSKWEFTNEQYKDFPLSFFNKFGKSVKFCDLSTITPNKEDSEFVLVEGNLKTKNKQYISKNITMGDKQKRAQGWQRIYTKKQKKNYKGFSNQYKTKFRQITVKNDWEQLKVINKRSLDEAPPISNVRVQLIKKKGQLRYLNPKVQRISWAPTGFKENQAYTIDHNSTMDDQYLASSIGASLFEQQYQQAHPNRTSVVCSSQFLFALMTVRGGQYPWAISVSKADNVIMLDRYHSNEKDTEFSYLDMFTPNENTTSNMPRDEQKVRQYCTTGTKITKIFKDLLASGDVCESQQLNQQKEHNDEFEDDDDEQETDEIKKYIKIEIDDIDIFTSVKINGMKKKSTGEEYPCLIRTFMQTGTDGGWIDDIKKTQGTLVFNEYLANSCSLQKWICQARLAGVQSIKFGFVGFSKQKPFIVNVQEATVSNLENYISFKQQDTYPILKFIIKQIANEPNGQYVLVRSPYTPLSLKLYKLPTKQQSEEQQDE